MCKNFGAIEKHKNAHVAEYENESIFLTLVNTVQWCSIFWEISHCNYTNVLEDHKANKFKMQQQAFNRIQENLQFSLDTLLRDHKLFFSES